MHIFRKTTKFCIFGLRISNTVFEAAQCISAEKCLELHFLTVINDSTCIQYTVYYTLYRDRHIKPDFDEYGGFSNFDI